MCFLSYIIHINSTDELLINLVKSILEYHKLYLMAQRYLKLKLLLQFKT